MSTIKLVLKQLGVIVRSRYIAHVGCLILVGFFVLGNNPTRGHSLSVNLAAAGGSAGTVLDSAGVASVSAEIATKSQLLVTSEASKTATVKSEQVALATSDEGVLAKRQVVSTAGNATRDILTYTVVGGDTISGIAAKFSVTTGTIKWANDLDDADMVSPGEKLTILPTSGLLYTVQAGDTADTLADKYHANAAQIISYNDAEASGLQSGMKIIIPDGYKDEVKTTTSIASSSNYSSGSSTPQLTSYSGGGGGYAYGYCTYYVASRRSIPGNWGNANAWYWNAQNAGFSVGYTPVAGAIAWTGAGYYGHVAYVESVSGGMVTISEMNYNGGWNRVSWRTVSAGSFLYIY